jgi:hypothetical protein
MANEGIENRAQFWKKAIEEQRTSGLSIAEYCEAAETTVDRFYYWKRKLKNARKPLDQSDADHRFIELSVLPRTAEVSDSISISIGPFCLRYQRGTNRSLFREAAAMLLELHSGEEG